MKFTPHLLMLKRTSLNLFVILLGVFFILGSGGTPVITILGDNPATVQQGSVYVDAGATAKDDDGPRQISVTGLPIDTSVLGPHTVTYSVYGADGQLITAERIVNVVEVVVIDTTPPVITILGDNPVTVQQGDTYTDAGATAVDDVDGNVAVSVTSTVDMSTAGTYAVTYTASDSAGNTATDTRTVNVVFPPKNNFKIVLKTDQKIAGYEIALKFTTDLPLKVDIALNNTFLGQNGRNVSDLGPNIDKTEKIVTFGGFSFGNQEAIDGGEFDILTLKSKDTKSQISIIKKSCLDKDANTIDCDLTINKQ